MIGGKYKFLIISCCLILPIGSRAEVLSLDEALRTTYSACIGIDSSLTDLRKMAGINTVVTGVGTGFGAGATIVGVKKANKDGELEEWERTLNELIAKQEQHNVKYDKISIDDIPSAIATAQSNNKNAEKKVDELTKQSKQLGNWRTGLMVGNTATNIAGAVIAKNNQVDNDLQGQIDTCKQAVKNLQNSIMQAKFNGEDISEATNILNACRDFEYVDISPINKRAKGAFVSSIIGATTGVAGTITSAVANSEDIRKDEQAKQGKKTDDDWQKEKTINTAANVLAGTSTVASGVATVFNATQISAIKKVSAVAEKCTGVLK